MTASAVHIQPERLRALEIGPGGEALIPTNWFIATAEAVSLVGAVARGARRGAGQEDAGGGARRAGRRDGHADLAGGPPYVREAVEAQDHSGLQRAGINESSAKRGQDYMSVFADLQAPRGVCDRELGLGNCAGVYPASLRPTAARSPAFEIN